MASFVDRVVGVESGGNPNATNPRSSASGLGQFINSTWLSTVRAHRPDLAGRSDADLLALKNDPDLSREMTDAYGADNGGILSKAGLPVTDGTKYLAHFAGPQGAVGLLNADPSTPAAAILGQGFARANPTLAGYSAGQLAAWADRKMGGAAPSAPMSIAGPAAAPGAAPAAPAPAPAATAQPEPQQAAPAEKAPAFQIGGSGGGPAPNLAALTATPQLANILPPRPNFFGLKTAPFSLRGNFAG
jgi:hypothetical protein